MTKRILSILIVAALVGGAMFSAPAKTRAGAISATVVASPDTTGATSAVTINLTTLSAATTWEITFPSAFTVPSSIAVGAVMIGITPASASVVGNVVTLTTASVPAGPHSIVFNSSIGIVNPSTASNYTFAISTDGGDYASGFYASIVGGGGSGSLTITPSSTTAGATNVTLQVVFTPTYSVGFISLNLSGYNFYGTPSTSNVYGSGSGLLTSVSGSGSALYLTFGTALTAGYPYTLTITSGCSLMNPTTANTYTITANLTGGGSQTLSGTVTIGGGSGGLTITPSSTTAGATNVTLQVSFTPTYSVSTMLLYLSGYTFIGTPSLSNVYISGGSGLLTAVSLSGGNTLSLTFGTPLVAYSSYTLYIYPGSGLMNPTTANTYSITANLFGGGGQTLTGTVTIGGASVTIQSVSVNPLTPSSVAQFAITFYTSSSTAGIKSGDTIRVEFPAGTQFPSGSFCPTCFVINGQTVQVTPTRSNYVVTITVPATIPVATQYVYLTIGTTAGIVNPPTSGSYSLKVSTSIDTTQVTSNQYALVGTSISSLAVTANPTAQGAYPELRFTFTTSSSGGLSQNDYIYIQFPTAMNMPSSVPAASVTVNGVQVSSISLDGSDKLSIYTPISIGNSQQVAVVIAATSGISNPSTVGTTLSFSVSTSQDVGAQTVSYTTTTSQISQAQVTLTTNGLGKASGYTVTFQTGAGGALTAGIGRIYIVFPSGTTVPVSMAAANVRVNGVTASNVFTVTSNRRVEITTPVAVAGSSQITVVIDVAANIVNPSTPATSYTLAAYTSSEQTLVYSAQYSIVNLPTSTAVTNPTAPDGLNGYYRTRPTVSITATSPSGYPVSIYYRINSTTDTLYGGPVQIPDGTVTFTYYGKDSQNNQEQAKQLTFKVDATAPVVTILSPLEGTVTSTGALSITGRTEAGASVTINGTSVAVQANGDFGGSVALSEGANAIQVVATDLAGNVGQIRVNVTLDTKPPVLSITSPTIYSTVMTQQVAVTGKTDPGSIVTVGGSKVNVAADGSFSILYMFPKEGLNVIDITSTDAAGNVAKTGLPVTYVARTLIRLQVGNKTAMINDASKTLQAAPINVKGVVMVPLRFIGEAFGATVEWEPIFKLIRLQLGSTMIYLQIGSNYASVNGKKIVLQGLPTIIKGTTMVPIRFISEAFNAQVTWVAATQGVEITYPKP